MITQDDHADPFSILNAIIVLTINPENKLQQLMTGNSNQNVFRKLLRNNIVNKDHSNIAVNCLNNRITQ
jgi:hypothetical protein